MSNHNNLEKEIEKKIVRKDKRKKRKMKVSGKSVFNLKKVITQKSDQKGH
jgi:hypothetical protein